VREELPHALRGQILALGKSAVPELLSILEDEDLALAESPGEGWAPIHAVDLLVDLGATEAIEPLLRALAESEWDEILHDRILLRLHDLGPAVLEAALAALARTTDSEFRDAICYVLAELGVKDERIYAELCTLFDRDDTAGAGCFADYGDPRALPRIERALWEFDTEGRGTFGLMGLADLVEAYNELGGDMPPELGERIERVREEWSARFREKYADPPGGTNRKIGRNEPCPCGSGRKYKRCCLGSDEG
jgi:hypothetical protein